MKLTLYAIQERGTDKFLLGSLRAGRIGLTHVVPTTPSKEYPPAMFSTADGARKGLIMWRQGHIRRYGEDGYIDVEHVPARLELNMEIVPITVEFD